jgi:hypothetical protein
VDCECRRIDQEQLSFNVGFFNAKVSLLSRHGKRCGRVGGLAWLVLCRSLVLYGHGCKLVREHACVLSISFYAVLVSAAPCCALCCVLTESC